MSDEQRQQRAVGRAMTPDEIRNSLLPVFDQYGDRVAAVYLFGSTAAGETSELSDVDLAVLFKRESDRYGLDEGLALYADVCRALRLKEIDMIVLNSSRNLVLKDEIVRRGILLFDGDAEARTAFELRILHSAIDFRQQRRALTGV